MKYLKWTLFFCLPFLFQSCFDSEEPLFFATMERQFDIPANLSTIPTHFFELNDVPTFFQENLQIYNRTVDDISSVNPGDASISASILNLDWTFIDGVEIYMISRLDKNRRYRIFYADQADFNNRDEVRLFNTFADIKDVVSEGLVNLEVRIDTRTFVPQNIRANLVFNYGAFEEL